jgi:hypothetical protein
MFLISIFFCFFVCFSTRVPVFCYRLRNAQPFLRGSGSPEILSLFGNVHSLILIHVPFIFYYFVLRPTNAQLFHKLSHSYLFRHYRVILRELVINTCQVTQAFQMQLLVTQFTIKMFPIGFMQVLIL